MSHDPVLPLELQLLSLALLFAFFAWVIRLIRAQKLSIRDSLAWLLTTLLAITVTAVPSLLVAGARLVGVHVPANAIFGAGLLYVAVNVLSITIATSATASATRRLTQECALLRAELERLRAQVERAGGEPPRRE